MKLAQALEYGDLFPTKPTVLAEFSQRFHSWLDEARVEEKTRKYYRNGCRLLKITPIFAMRLTEITTEDAEKLKFPGSAGNANCALRTLRRMLHKAEEWKLIARAPKIKLMKEHGRDVRLDADAEEKLVRASIRCKWRTRTRELFGDIVVLMRDTGMRNERELFQMRVENLDWNNRTIFVPDSKTPEGRRLVPMSRRVLDILKKRCGTRTDGWVFPSKRSASRHLRSICNLFRQARNEAGLPRELVLYCARHDYGTRVLMRTVRDEMSVSETAVVLGVTPTTVLRLIRLKQLPATQACVGAPWVLHRADVEQRKAERNRPAPPPTVDSAQLALEIP